MKGKCKICGRELGLSDIETGNLDMFLGVKDGWVPAARMPKTKDLACISHNGVLEEYNRQREL